MQETDIEVYPKEFIESEGGFYIKLPARFYVGIPDRLVLLPYRCIFFVETKYGDNDLTRIQKFVHNQIRKLGFSVYTLESKKLLLGLIKSEYRKAKEKYKK